MPGRGSHGVNTRTGHETVGRLGRRCALVQVCTSHADSREGRSAQDDADEFVGVLQAWVEVGDWRSSE